MPGRSSGRTSAKDNAPSGLISSQERTRSLRHWYSILGDSGSPRAKVVYRAAAGNSSPVIISGGIPVTDFSCTVGNICTSSVTGLPAGLMPRQFYVNGQRAIRARSNYGQAVNLNYLRVSNGYTQFIPETFTHPELMEAVSVTQWKMLRCPVASLTGNTLVMQTPCWTNANSYASPVNFQLLSWLENAPEFVTVPKHVVPRPLQSAVNLLQYQQRQS